jgi:hypothetical protein
MFFTFYIANFQSYHTVPYLRNLLKHSLVLHGCMQVSVCVCVCLKMCINVSLRLRIQMSFACLLVFVDEYKHVPAYIYIYIYIFNFLQECAGCMYISVNLYVRLHVSLRLYEYIQSLLCII